jgi:hypothetical protein
MLILGFSAAYVDPEAVCRLGLRLKLWVSTPKIGVE